MQIFSKSYLNICNLLNINKIQRYNLLQCKRAPFRLQYAANDNAKGMLLH